MNMYIENIKKLNLPERKKGDTHANYIKRVLLTGHKFNTREARHIGIGNLHSIKPVLNKQQFPFKDERKRVIDPATGEIPIHTVLVIYMTAEQIQAYKRENAQQKPSV
ncbi:hypothetical protein [Vibrio casei]|uniref:hypothetical protein n=1 Tax=Vibrio casei TaxID=673372 RepID=UPI003F982847